MSAPTVRNDPGQSWDELVRLWEEMDWPEGCKVEIVDGTITVSPSPAYQHNYIAARIQRRLYSVLPEHWECFQTLGVAVPSRMGMLVPDVLMAPALENGESYSNIPAAMAELVVEITSRSNATHDRISKCAAYAAAGIPFFLLIDRFAPEGPVSTLFGEPHGDVYRPLSVVKFGEPLELPAPFNLTIDTGEFPTL
ncbi:Uma2 family endonuclease [Streptomyces sp. NPDC016845]|uniref:Uma2 family endonuclease n=1 Tax=Streptomyces sp. NPDC016845 TaxID=3364972 RepID=UPI0037A195E9